MSVFLFPDSLFALERYKRHAKVAALTGDSVSLTLIGNRDRKEITDFVIRISKRLTNGLSDARIKYFVTKHNIEVSTDIESNEMTGNSIQSSSGLSDGLRVDKVSEGLQVGHKASISPTLPTSIEEDVLNDMEDISNHSN